MPVGLSPIHHHNTIVVLLAVPPLVQLLAARRPLLLLLLLLLAVRRPLSLLLKRRQCYVLPEGSLCSLSYTQRSLLLLGNSWSRRRLWKRRRSADARRVCLRVGSSAGGTADTRSASQKRVPNGWPGNCQEPQEEKTRLAPQQLCNRCDCSLDKATKMNQRSGRLQTFGSCYSGNRGGGGVILSLTVGRRN